MNTAHIWSCPFCREGLLFDELGKFWSCINNHSFDCAREGYVNLLPSNKKRSSDPGDNALMIAARRRIHGAEIYRPLADAILDEWVGSEPVARILDLGCGEGYYSNTLAQALPDAKICGVDISRPAIKLAAKNYPAINFAVASSFHLPVASGSQDFLLRVFAPSDDEEVCRVLREGGVYLEVTPAPTHLWALREALYDTPRAHGAARTQIQGMALRHSSTVEFEVTLGRTLLADLVAMTPFAHRGHREKRERLLTRETLTLSLVFSLNFFQNLADGK